MQMIKNKKTIIFDMEVILFVVNQEGTIHLMSVYCCADILELFKIKLKLNYPMTQIETKIENKFKPTRTH